MKSDDRLLAYLSTGIINRKLFKLEFSNRKFEEVYIQMLRQKVETWWQGPPSETSYLFLKGQESNHAYNPQSGEIKILFNNGEVQPMSALLESGLHFKNVIKHYLAYPKM
jgi:CRP-like cAMP-binding protein